MSLQIYLSSSGARLHVNLESISSPDILKSWIEQHTRIPVERQILMTAKGKNVKQQHLLAEAQIFVYDKNYLTEKNDEEDQLQRETITELRTFPSTLEDEQSLAAWQDLFAARRAWALEVVAAVKSGAGIVETQADESEVLESCTQVALENLQNHFLSLQQTAQKTQAWAKDAITDHAEVLKDWRTSASALSELPVREEIAQLLHWPGDRTPLDSSGTMFAMLDMAELEAASQSLALASESFGKSMKEIQAYITTLKDQTTEVTNLGMVEWPALNTEGLVQEIEAMAAKASRDYEDVLRSSDDQKAIAAVSRQAARHTSELLPAMDEMGKEIYRMVEDVNDHRERIYRNSRRSLTEISRIQSKFAEMHSRISSLQFDDQAQSSLETLAKVFRLPIAYGSTMVEAARRTEWNDRMRTDLATMREEISHLKDDELRRRKKWMASLADFLDGDHATADNLIDLNFSAPSNKWPFVSRDEVISYIEDLRALHMEDAVRQVSKLLTELDSAVRIKRTKPNAFKTGSVFDLSQSNVRTGEQVKSLQDERLRLEEKLRASDSRIRKLEDLLHRQSQLSRPTSASFTPQLDLERQGSSTGLGFARPVEMQSRRSSVSLRRLSNQNLDDKAMVQRIVALEAQITKLQEEAHAERRSSTESRDKMQEAESVKRDLMANFEAQRQEFDDERQLMEDENHKLKLRLEEIEDELEQVLGSRDHSRMTQEQTNTSLRAEMDQLRRAMGEEIDQLRRSKERLQGDYVSQRDRLTSSERQLQHFKDEKSTLQSQNMSLAGQLRAAEEQQQEVIVSLQAAYSNLSPSSSAPEGLSRLVRAIEVLTEGAAIHARGLDDNLQLATAEGKSQKETISALELRIQRNEKELEASRRMTAETLEELSEQRNRLTTVRTELSNEQGELLRLREKFAAGETGSDALKARLAEEERHISNLLDSDSQKAAQIEALQHEIQNLTAKGDDSNAAEKALKDHFDARKAKARDLSERLFQHNDRIVRMLENFGYVITRQGDTLVMQRASKVSASIMLSGEGGSPMKRTVSGSTPLQHYSEPSDLDTLYWGSDESQQTEDTKYDTFIKAITRLDLDSTLETVTKRYKDVEGLAKKYQKDSRAYRDRCNRLQSEAHEKIAYRSFKEGDLALFLPTRNQATRPWAAFNVGAPHYFLREQDVHKLQSREWLLARITKVEERIVDLTKSITSTRDRSSMHVEGSDGGSLRSVDDENPFELSDGLRWYMIDAVEEKPGAPSTPGLGKSTAAASVIDVKGHMSRRALTGKEIGDGNAVNVAKTLSKSLDSRRSSGASKKSGNVAALRTQGSASSGVHNAATAATTTSGTGMDGLAEGHMATTATPSVRPSDEDERASSQGGAREDARVFDVEDAAPRTAWAARNTSSRRAVPAESSASPSSRALEPASQRSSPSKRSWDKLFSLEFRG